jgi:hypothetical protein
VSDSQRRLTPSFRSVVERRWDVRWRYAEVGSTVRLHESPKARGSLCVVRHQEVVASAFGLEGRRRSWRVAESSATEGLESLRRSRRVVESAANEPFVG